LCFLLCVFVLFLETPTLNSRLCMTGAYSTPINTHTHTHTHLDLCVSHILMFRLSFFWSLSVFVVVSVLFRLAHIYQTKLYDPPLTFHPHVYLVRSLRLSVLFGFSLPVSFSRFISLSPYLSPRSLTFVYSMTLGRAHNEYNS
jgi:hypothetical protein